MASLVAEVLATSGGLEKEDLTTRMSKISDKVDSVKCDLNSCILQKYRDFNPSFVSTIDLHSKVESISKEMTSLTSKIQNDVSSQISSSTHDFHDLSSQLGRTNAIIDTLKVLCKVNESLQNFSMALSNNEYMTACDLLETIQEQMKILSRGKVCEMKIMNALKTELRVNQETLIQSLIDAWSAAVVWKIPAVRDADNVEAILTTQLSFSRGSKVEDIIRAMYAAKILNNRLQAFGKKVVENLFKHMILVNGLEPTFESTYQNITIRLSRNPSQSKHITPQLLYKHILSILEKLHKQLIGITLEDKQTGEEISLMRLFGDMIWKDLSQYIINHCLVHSIPTSSEQLESYMEVIQATEDFEKTLVKWGLQREDTSPLLTYAKNVNVHFANKKCQDLMVKARKLMTSELHNTVDVGDDGPAEKLAKLADTDARDEKTAIADKDILSDGTLRFPQCKISESVHRLMKLCYETLQESVTSSTQCAVQLFYSVRNMLELFCEVVPTYHKQSLHQLPQLSALHHNNCMYIAHHMLTLGHQYKSQLPFPLSEGPATMIDLVPIYRRLASECFMTQMRTQRSHLLESLSGASGFTLLEDAENRERSTRAVKQVLHQLNHLSTVWRDVLPSSVYEKAMSALINTLLQEMIDKIMALEDISVEDASGLASLMELVIEKIPPLLKRSDSEEKVAMPIHVSQWTKFTELITVLEANLQEILDLWTDGKGPLAHAMTANEVRNLIRALFQNTEKRAATLAKIKTT